MTADRNRKIVERVLEGEEFKSVAATLNLSPVTVRTIFHSECRKLDPELYEKGKNAIVPGSSCSGATPSVIWMRQKRIDFLNAPALRAKKKLEAEVSAAIALIEACGYTVTPNA